jgi:hypothetical protein
MRDLILAKVPTRCQIQMRIDALYALIEISTAIGYALRGTAPDLIRSGDVLVPGFLIKGMCNILNDLEEWELRHIVTSERAFVAKIKELK